MFPDRAHQSLHQVSDLTVGGIRLCRTGASCSACGGPCGGIRHSYWSHTGIWQNTRLYALFNPEDPREPGTGDRVRGSAVGDSGPDTEGKVSDFQPFLLPVGVPAPPFFPLSVTNLTSRKNNRSIEKQAMDLTYDNFTTLMRSGGHSMVSLCWKLLVRFRKIPGNAVPVAAVFRMSSRLFMQYRHRISAQRNGRERSSYPLPPAARIRGIARTAAPSGDLRGPLEAVPSRGSGLPPCHAPGLYKVCHTVLQEPTIGLCPDLPRTFLQMMCRIFSRSRFYSTSFPISGIIR